MRASTLLVVGVALAGLAQPADARSRRAEDRGGVPDLNVKTSCGDAQKFSGNDQNHSAYKGCMQDETNAKNELARRWSQFKPRDRQNCVEQSRDVAPSYVEVLTCLEMDSNAMQSAPKGDAKPTPQIGGPVAPGLSTGPAAPVPSQSPITQ